MLTFVIIEPNQMRLRKYAEAHLIVLSMVLEQYGGFLDEK